MTTKLAAIFFLISDSLLWPVMLGLLVGLAISLWRLGTTAREALERFRERKIRRRIELALDENRLDDAESEIRTSNRAQQSDSSTATIRRLFDSRADLPLTEKILADAQNRRAERSTTLRLLMKFAPAFGLMGTLIPLGPALVGLATCNLEILAQNLGIAFATTVVGLVVGALAFFSATLEKRWATRDAILTTFAAERILAATTQKEENQ